MPRSPRTELAGIREAAADELLAVKAATTGRRGPGQPGSARIFPGESSSPAAGFGPGMALDVLPGCAGLAAAADAASGDEDGFAGVSEAELVGIVCAWDRVEAHAAARKLAAIAELGRRNPGPEDAEFTADQLACALADSRGHAGGLLDLADSLGTRLPGTKAALLDGTISRYKAETIAGATALLDPDEAAAAEDKVLDRAARLTPGALRAAIARAVMEVAPDKARQRRETAARDARVERWIEDSGNAALMGCELPPDEVLAADQRITWWAHELKKAGLDGGMDQLRARAYLDLLLGKDSRPRRRPEPAHLARTAEPPGRQPGGRRGSRRVRRPGHADRPAGYPGPPRRPAGRAGRPGPGRPVAGPGPGHRRRGQPEDHVVRDRHRRRGPCHRPRLRPARAQESPETRRTRTARRDGVHLHPSQPGRPARRIRHLDGSAPPDPDPDLIITLEPLTTDPCDHRHESKPPRPRGQAAAPVPDPARHLHQPRLPPARRPVRPRAQHPLRGRRPQLPVQHRPQMPPRPPAQAAPQVARSTSSPTAPSAGPPRPAAPTPPNPPATPSDGAGGHKSRTRSAEGWEQQIRTLPSAGSSTGSGE